jgi:hypothetical protein
MRKRIYTLTLENCLALLMQIKSDMERQGDFIRFLIKEVEGATFANIEDVVTFVKWLDDKLSRLVRARGTLGCSDYRLIRSRCTCSMASTLGCSDYRLIRSRCTCRMARLFIWSSPLGPLPRLQVDERAVLKHFEWPEQKADALREAAFGYCDLKKQDGEAASFRDDTRQTCAAALKKLQALFEK